MKTKSRSNVKVPKVIEFPNEPTMYKVADCCNQPPKDMKTSGVKSSRRRCSHQGHYGPRPNGLRSRV
jgi:hypothetical protein